MSTVYVFIRYCNDNSNITAEFTIISDEHPTITSRYIEYRPLFAETGRDFQDARNKALKRLTNMVKYCS